MTHKIGQNLHDRIALGRELYKTGATKAEKFRYHQAAKLGKVSEFYLKLADKSIAKLEKKERFADLTRHQWLGLFDLVFFPEDRKSHLQKQLFMKQNMPAGKGMQIVAQAAKYPIMRQAVEEIRENLDKWDDSSELKETISGQLQRLAALSNNMAEAAKHSEEALMLFSDPGPILRTDLPLKERLKEFEPGDQLQKRESLPVTKKAIELQAELHRTMREGKVWASRQTTLTPQGKSVNKVFKIYKQNEPEITAFFKLGSGDEEGAGRMEKLMWDMAVLLGLEGQFVPTGETALRTESELKGGGQKVMSWEENLDLRQVNEAKESKKGGIQVAQKGATLGDLKDTTKIERREVANGILASVVFGMFDAHWSNIFVTQGGEIKFFDNTRSFPNSNGFIRRGPKDIISSFRCALLDLPQASEPLTAEELKDLRAQVDSFKQKSGKIWEFLNSPQTQAILGKLPPGWIDVKGAFDALQTRVDLLDEALKKGSIKTGLDIALQSLPDYKFTYALTYLYLEIYGSTKVEEDQIHNCVGYYSISQVVDSLEKKGVDIKKIKKWSQDPNLSFSALVKKIKNSDPKDISKLPLDSDVEQFYQDLKSQIMSDTAVDYKDVSRATCEVWLAKHKTKALKRVGVPYLHDTLAGALTFLDKTSKVVIFEEGGEEKAVYLTSTGVRVKKIQLNPVVDKVGDVPYADFFKGLTESTEPPRLDELADIPLELTKQLLEGRKPFLSKTLQGNKECLVITRKKNNKIIQTIHKPAFGEKFQFRGKPYTIKQIIDFVA